MGLESVNIHARCCEELSLTAAQMRDAKAKSFPRDDCQRIKFWYPERDFQMRLLLHQHLPQFGRQ